MVKGVSTLAIIFLFIITSCTTKIDIKPQYSGDHSTAQIRGMWHVCYQTRVRNMPHLPHIIHWEHCDCLIDKSRESFSSKDYDQMGSDNLTMFFKKASLICDQDSVVAPDPASV